MQYVAKIYKDGSGYSVEFPDVPGAFSCGRTLNAAKVNAKEALELWLESVLDGSVEMPVSKAVPCESNGLFAIELDPRMSVALEMHEARKGLKSKVVAKRMGISPQAFVRLQKSKSNVSVSTLARYAAAVGKRLEIRLI